jgi:cell division protein FtsQ
VRLITKILIIIISLYLVVMPAWLTGRSKDTICTGMGVVIIDSADYHLVTKRELMNIVNASGARIAGARLRDIPGAYIEERITGLRELKEAEVYTTVDGMLHVYADQRNPIMRIIAGGGDYFLDEDGVVIRRKKLYTPRLHIAEGNIRITSKMLEGTSVLDTAIKKSILKDLYVLVDYIRNDDFWSAQMGNHRIHMGTMENFRGKLRNLEVFYKEVLPVAGWNRYSMIDLEFRDQIVCRKRQ